MFSLHKNMIMLLLLYILNLEPETLNDFFMKYQYIAWNAIILRCLCIYVYGVLRLSKLEKRCTEY